MPRTALPVQLSAEVRSTLDKFVHSSSTPQSLALRSRIVLAAADGSNNQKIAAALGIPPVTVGKWRQSFAVHGMEGLRDAPRSGRPPKHDAGVRHRVQTRVCQQPDDQSRWTVRTLATELGLPASTVHAMLVAAKLQPHRTRTFTFSPDPDLEAKHPGAGSNTASVAATREETSRLDQRIRPSRHANIAGRSGDRNRQSGRACS